MWSMIDFTFTLNFYKLVSIYQQSWSQGLLPHKTDRSLAMAVTNISIHCTNLQSDGQADLDWVTGYTAQRLSPIPLLTGLNVEKQRSSQPMQYYYIKPLSAKGKRVTFLFFCRSVVNICFAMSSTEVDAQIFEHVTPQLSSSWRTISSDMTCVNKKAPRETKTLRAGCSKAEPNLL